MTKPDDTIRVIIPLRIRKRNGRPKILPPESVQALEVRSQDPHILKALGRAWAWRRKLESGEVATAGELAKMESVTERFVSRTVRLAYLSPEVLERLGIRWDPPVVKVSDLIEVTYLSWTDQIDTVFYSGLPRKAPSSPECGRSAVSS